MAGVTYYAPIDCDHTDIRCRNVKYPEFDLLAAKFAEVQVDVPSLDKYNPPDIPVPECPASIAPLSDFDWPSAKEQDFWCPPDDELYVCSCAVTLAPTPSPNLGPIMAPKPEGWVPTEPIFQEASLSSRRVQLSMTLTLMLLLLLVVNMDL